MPKTPAATRGLPRGSSIRCHRARSCSRIAAARKRMPAPKNGGSSRLLKRTATWFAPPRSTTRRKPASTIAPCRRTEDEHTVRRPAGSSSFRSHGLQTRPAESSDQSHGGTAVIGFIRVLLVVEAATFLVASLLHLGALRPLATALGEPVIPQAGIPEGVIGLVLVIGAAAASSGRVGGGRPFVAPQPVARLGIR